MSAVLEETVWDELVSRPARQGFEYAWTTIAAETSETPVLSNANHYAALRHRSVSNVYGEGRIKSSTQLSVLDFIGTRYEDGDDGGEFAFVGSGTVSAYGRYQKVFLRGTATRTFKLDHTPFLEGFHGHAVISEDEYTWFVNQTDLYRVTGVVPATPPARRARHQPPSRAYNAFQELSNWLQMSDEELAAVIKVARGTVSASWKNGNEPRKREQARRLFQLHGLVSALHAMLGDGLAAWLKRGSPCPLTLLERGNVDQFERLADTVIFPPNSESRPRLDAAWPANTAGTARDGAERPRLKRSARVRSRRLER
jgi:hypothetical protein